MHLTALYEVLRLALEEGGIKPALIIGIPVGFCRCCRTQRLFDGSIPSSYITVKG